MSYALLRIHFFPVFKHLFALFLLYLTNQFLQRWILFRHSSDYFLALSLFSAAVILVAWRFILKAAQQLSRMRRMVLFILLVLCLPWGQWLRVNLELERENWSLQIFHQFLFLYGTFLVLVLWPKLSFMIQKYTHLALSKCSSNNFIFWLFPVLFFFFTSWIALSVYEQTPLVYDSAAHLFQAKIFSNGQLTAPAPPLPDFFSSKGDMLVMKSDRWFSMYSPGFSLMLTPALLVRAEWLMAPLLGAVNLLLWISYVRRYHGKEAAVLFALLAIFSPFLFVMFSTIEVHSAELSLVTAVIFLSKLQEENPTRIKACALAAILSFGIIVRPFSFLMFLAPVVFYTVWHSFRSKQWFSMIAPASGILIGVLLLSLYQWKTTGDPFLSGYLIEYPEYRYGFGKSFLNQLHTPVRALDNTSNHLLSMNRWLTGWYSGSLFFIFWFLSRKRKLQQWDILLLTCCASLIAFYFFFIAQDLFLGPRYIFITAPVGLMLIARAALAQSSPRIAAMVVISFLSFFPHQFWNFLHRYDENLRVAKTLKQELKEIPGNKTIVFLETLQSNFVDWNDPFLGGPILVRDQGAANAKVFSIFSDRRPVYFRSETRLDKLSMRGGFQLFKTRRNSSTQRVGYLDLSLQVDALSRLPQNDLFDTYYLELSKIPDTTAQFQSLNEDIRRIRARKQSIHQLNFALGSVHVIRMLLLPKIAFEKQHEGWANALDISTLRSELLSAVADLEKSGAIGKPMLMQLTKVRKRIDQNNDQQLTDQEIVWFLAEKIELLKFGWI